jgi:hypothetical protein
MDMATTYSDLLAQLKRLGLPEPAADELAKQASYEFKRAHLHEVQPVSNKLPG